MNANPALDTQIKVHKAAGLAQSTIQRLLAQEQAATVDVLDDLGRAFGFKQPHHFLLEDAEAAMLKLWSNLDDAGKATALTYVRFLAEQSERAASSGPTDLASLKSYRVDIPTLHDTATPQYLPSKS